MTEILTDLSSLAFCRETHDFQLNLTVSRYATKISRFLENLAFFKENLPFFSVPKNFKSLFKNQAILKNKFSHKEQIYPGRCQIRLSLATSLSYTKPRPRDILVQIKVADFEEIETLMVFLLCSTPKKGHLFLRSPQKYLDNSQSPDFY